MSRINIYDENHNPDFDNKNQILFLGDCMGVRLVPRSETDKHIMFELMVEDDDNWFCKGGSDSGWIDELIEQLQAARSYLQTQTPAMHEGRRCGWDFNNKRRKK